jgi:SNF2 family DNA or RNA helicase
MSNKDIIQSIIDNPGKYKLMEHQKESLYFSENKPNVLLLLAVGTGKTGCMLSILRMRYAQEGRRMKTLIISPLVVVGNIVKEFEYFTPYDPKTIHKLNQSTSKKKAEYMRKNLSSNGIDMDIPDVVVVNYDSLITADMAQAILDWGPEVVCFDEVHRLKSPKSKRTKVAKILSKTAKYKIMLSGSFILNGAMDVFAPFNILDNGETFGDNIYVYQSKYMIDKNAAWKGRTGYFPKWETNPKTTDELHEKIFRKAFTKKTSECIDLPEFIEQVIEVEASPEQKRMYNDMVKLHMAFITENQDKPKTATAQLAMTKALRLLQICSGFITADDGSIVAIKDNPRIKATAELLETIIDEGEKCIIWASFIYDYKQLSEMLEGMKIKYVMLTGGQDGKEKDKAIDDFQNDPSVKVVIANRKSASEGITLTRARYSIVFSRNFSLAEEIQSKARNYRKGSEVFSSVIKYDICMRDSIDFKTLEALKSKKNISDMILDSEYVKEIK